MRNSTSFRTADVRFRRSIVRFVVSTFSICATLLCAGAVFAQTFPTKPVRIVTAQAGGGTDFVARIIAQGLTESLKQQVIVDNRGGNVAIGAELVARSPPDGHTLVLKNSRRR